MKGWVCVFLCMTACTQESRALTTPQMCGDIRGSTGKSGSCISKNSCLSTNSLIVGNKCPGSTYCCIQEPFPCHGETTVEMEKHLAKGEGNIWLEGYIPTAGSGVTIATGYDLGHGPNIERCLNNPSLWKLLKPYRGLKSVAALKRARFNVKTVYSRSGKVARYELYNRQPIITLRQARSIDCCLKTEAFKSMARYTGNMQCGKTVVVSLTHWCGRAGVLGGGSHQKCKTSSNYDVRDVLKRKGSDRDLLQALKNLYKAHTVTYKKTRVKTEIGFMETCMKSSVSPGTTGCEGQRPRCSSETAPKCAAVGGYCGHISKCPGSKVVRGKCPGNANIICCTAQPQQEKPCSDAGGQCRDVCGCKGRTRSGLCPGQPASVRCCLDC